MNEVLNNLLTRRACRAYTGEQVKKETLDAILEAGTYAPTGRGGQSPVIVVTQDASLIAELEKLNAQVLGNPDMHPFYGAPTLVIVFGDPGVPFCESDGNLVIGNLLNAANAVGVDSCYIWRAREVFSSEAGLAYKKAWGVPESYVGIGHVILGYGKSEGKRAPVPRKENYIIRV